MWSAGGCGTLAGPAGPGKEPACKQQVSLFVLVMHMVHKWATDTSGLQKLDCDFGELYTSFVSTVSVVLLNIIACIHTQAMYVREIQKRCM
jgi:hypothetical protein